MNNYLIRSSFLEEARKEAKELLAKFNARDECRLLLLLISAQKGNTNSTRAHYRAQKSIFPSFIAFPIRSVFRNFAPNAPCSSFGSDVFWSEGLLLTQSKIFIILISFDPFFIHCCRFWTTVI